VAGLGVILTVKPLIRATAVLTSAYTPGDGQFVVGSTATYLAAGKVITGMNQYSYTSKDATHFLGVTIDGAALDRKISVGNPAIQKVDNSAPIQRQLTTEGYIQTKGHATNVQGGYGLPSVNPERG